MGYGSQRKRRGERAPRLPPKRSRRALNSDSFVCLMILTNSSSVSELNLLVKSSGKMLQVYSPPPPYFDACFEWFFFVVTSEFTRLLHAQKQFHAESCYKVDQWIRNKPKCLWFRSKHLQLHCRRSPIIFSLFKWNVCQKTFQRTVFLIATDKDFSDCSLSTRPLLAEHKVITVV